MEKRTEEDHCGTVWIPAVCVTGLCHEQDRAELKQFWTRAGGRQTYEIYPHSPESREESIVPSLCSAVVKQRTAVKEIVPSVWVLWLQSIILTLFHLFKNVIYAMLGSFCNNVSLQLFSFYFDLLTPCILLTFSCYLCSGWISLSPFSSASKIMEFPALKRMYAYSSLFFLNFTRAVNRNFSRRTKGFLIWFNQCDEWIMAIHVYI